MREHSEFLRLPCASWCRGLYETSIKHNLFYLNRKRKQDIFMKVLFSQKIPNGCADFLRSSFRVEVPREQLSKEKLVARITDKDALVCSTNDIVDAEVIEAGSRLKVISTIGAGFENIDVHAASKRGVVVANSPRRLDHAVAELAFAHMLALSRKILNADNYIRSGQFKKWSFDLFVGTEFWGKTLGIVGLGNIGQRLVRIGNGFGMNVVYTRKHGEHALYKNTSVKFCSFKEVLASSDYVVLLVPLSQETRHFISRREFTLMKRSAVLVNMARGAVVKEDDLVHALKNGVIAGACLDVFEYEPCVAQSLIRMKNRTILTPHIGSATVEARSRIAECAAQNVIDVLSGNACSNTVNKICTT